MLFFRQSETACISHPVPTEYIRSAETDVWEINRDEKRKKSTKHFIEKQDMATRAFGLTGYTDSGKGEKERKTRS